MVVGAGNFLFEIVFKKTIDRFEMLTPIFSITVPRNKRHGAAAAIRPIGVGPLPIFFLKHIVAAICLFDDFNGRR